jgi:hypothetical protein
MVRERKSCVPRERELGTNGESIEARMAVDGLTGGWGFHLFLLDGVSQQSTMESVRIIIRTHRQPPAAPVRAHVRPATVVRVHLFTIS